MKRNANLGLTFLEKDMPWDTPSSVWTKDDAATREETIRNKAEGWIPE